ncbi:MAG TPA: tetratricopeptide repeat protein, partial [Opitutaceae bacterium]|nr:tetratricopeptide repeat protein [Opitutaceae bacterium]
ELLRHLREWARAEADFAAAARLSPELATIDFFRARTWLEAGDFAQARSLADRFVRAVPAEAEGWFLRGDILAALNDPAGAASDYAEGIRLTPTPRPEHFLRHAQFLARAEPANPSPALAALDQGIARVGPVVTLVDYAITLELERGNSDAALTRIALAMENAPRRETWLVRRAEILAQSGRAAEAAAAYRGALAAINELPERYQQTASMKTIAADARRALARLTLR